jgi:hypothetical protein
MLWRTYAARTRQLPKTPNSRENSLYNGNRSWVWGVERYAETSVPRRLSISSKSHFEVGVLAAVGSVIVAVFYSIKFHSILIQHDVVPAKPLLHGGVPSSDWRMPGLEDAPSRLLDLNRQYRQSFSVEKGVFQVSE